MNVQYSIFLYFVIVLFIFLSKATFKHVARTVAHVELADHVVAIVFSIFDIDGINKLTN